MINMNRSKEFHQVIKQLNINQKEAVDAINGPLNIIANAGTGKTTVVALRCCTILEKTDFKPSNILCLTFSNAGVGSMKKKLKELIGNAGENIKVCTFHSFSNDILKLIEDKSKITNKSIITPVQRMMILEKIINDSELAGTFYDGKPPTFKKLNSLHKIFNLLKKEYISKEDLIAYCNRSVESILPFEQEYLTKKGVLNAEGKKIATKIENFSKYISSMYHSYQNILDEKSKYEFIDMLTEAIYILENRPDIRLGLQEQFQYIMVDEFQDTNTAMLVLISLLIKDVDQPNIAFVGDECQTIYRFQGANMKNYEWTNKLLPGMRTIVLDSNYRSTTSILNKSYELISQSNSIHPLKKAPLKMGSIGLDRWNSIEPFITSFEDKEQEAYLTALKIKELISHIDSDENIAVLSRKNDDLLLIKSWLGYFQIPCHSTAHKGNVLETLLGKAIYYTLSTLKYWYTDEKHADAYFCHLLLECGYKTEVGYAFLQYKKLKPAVSFIYWILASTDLRNITLKSVASDLSDLELLKHQVMDSGLVVKLETFIFKTTQHYEKIWIKEAWENFMYQFIESDKGKSLKSLCELLDYYQYYKLSIDFENQTSLQSRVILSTIHGSKGLEYDHVFVLGLESENFENKKEVYDAINIPKILNRFINTDAEDIEDYRRLLYVAMTRAKNTLHLSFRRKSFSGKDQQLTSLLIKQNSETLLKIVYQKVTEMPKPKVDKYYLHLDEDFKKLVNEKLKEFHISASSTHNWEQCQNKFFYHNICKIPSLPSAPTSFGVLVHSILQKIVVNNILQPTTQEISDLVADEFLAFRYLFHPLHRIIFERYAMEVIGNYLSEMPIMCKPALTEEYLTSTLENGVRINGYIDRIDSLNDSSIQIIDYKTNKFAEKLQAYVDQDNPGSLYWRQGKMYSMLVKAKYGSDKNVSMSFHYITLKKKIEFFDENFSGFENWLLHIWNDIKNLHFSTNCSDASCIYCQGMHSQSLQSLDKKVLGISLK